MSLSAIRHRGPARVEPTIAESAAIEDGCPYDWDLDTGDDFCPVCDRCGLGQVLPCGCDASGLWPWSEAVATRLAEVTWSR